MKTSTRSNLPIWLLRIALAAAFVSAVADRLGFWGPPGARNVAWGNWPSFVAYVATLNWFLPSAVIPTLAFVVTVLELLLAAALVAGFWLRTTAVLAGVLLTAFGVAMTAAIGIKAPLDHSVFTAAAGCMVLAWMSADDPLSGRIRALLPPSPRRIPG